MKCTTCDHANREAAAFCEACGSHLTPTCPRCSTELRPGARYCDACGQALTTPSASLTDPSAAPAPRTYMPRHLAEKILNSRASLEGERRQITALFADVVDSTPLAERLGPEETHALIRRCFDLMLEAVHRYEGIVSQFTGDGILALFGAPIAHEDHAQRAVRAALAIQQAMRELQGEIRTDRDIAVEVRIGINTGPVVVGTIGTDLNMTYTAIGDTMNLASRIQGLAEPGAVVISEATQRLVSGYFVSRDLGRSRVKGKTEAIGVFRVLRPSRRRSRLDVYAEQGLSPLVGREQELEALVERYNLARAGHGQVVLISGDPGIGKSRLLHELKQRLEGEELTWLEGRCISYGRDIAYLPIVDVLKENFRIDEADDEAAIISKVDLGVEAMGGDLTQHLPFLKLLLSVDPGDAVLASMDPQLRKAHLFDALRVLTLSGAAIHPLVIVVEDLHWIDRPSEEWISTVLDAVSTYRVLLLLTYRPEYEVPFGRRPHFTALHLDSLSAHDSAALATGLLDVDRLPDDLQRVVVGKAEGNPFFLEEVLRSLLETGAIRRDDSRFVLARSIDEIYVPDTIQDIIMARLDRLPDDPKRALQTAAVIGREFTVRLLDRATAVTGLLMASLQELKAVELIFERALYPELAYMFKHALTHDVAYNSLLVARRRVLHRIIGLAIEELYADRIPEQYEILAHHFTRAEEWDRALDYRLKSARKATDAFAVREALAHYDEALTVAERPANAVAVTTRLQIHGARSDLLFGIGEYPAAREAAARLLTLAREIGDQATESRALLLSANAAMWMEEFDIALAETDEAVAIGEAVGASASTIASMHVGGFIKAVRGDLAEGERQNQRALLLSRAAGDYNIEGQVLHILSVSASWQGRFEEALALANEGVRIGREHRLVLPLLRCLWNLGVTRPGLGDFDGGLAALEEALALSERIDDGRNVGRNLNTMAWLRIDCGDWDKGLQLGWRALDLARQERHATGLERVAFIQANQSVALVATGDLAGAAECLEEALHIVEHPPPSRWMTWRYATHCYASLGELELARGDLDRADRYANQSLEIATAYQARKYESRVWRLKGEVALARQRLDDADQPLRQALDISQSIGEARQLWKAYEALGRLRHTQGRPDAASELYSTGRTAIDGVLERTTDSGLRAGLERLPEIQALLAHASR